MQQLTPLKVQKKLRKGAMLIDIREPRETAREYIENAYKWPLSQMPDSKPSINKADEVIFYCRSGARTSMNAQKLAALLPNKSYILTGGISGWKSNGLDVIIDKSAPAGLPRGVSLAFAAIVIITIAYFTK